jgi:hypothetical protein
MSTVGVELSEMVVKLGIQGAIEWADFVSSVPICDVQAQEVNDRCAGALLPMVFCRQ